jgi:predicted nucleic acid-binding protein
LAVNGRADVIVSGDADLLVLDPFRDIPILTPAIFGRAQIPHSGMESMDPDGNYPA